jgi:lysyl-tRNA synthetase class 2
MTPPGKNPWWRPDAFAARAPFLAARDRLRQATRAFFAARGFTEVETPALQVSPGLEPHLKAFATTWNLPDGGRRPFYLHTSPEFAMKKLLAAGMGRIWQMARVFRDGEGGATHHPEFSMIEWYRAGAGPEAIMADCVDLLRACRDAWPPVGDEAGDEAGARRWHWRGTRCDPASPWERLTVAQAFARHAGIDLHATAPDPQAPDAARLAAEARRIGIATRDEDRWDDVFFRIFLDRIEPKLGVGRPTLLHAYPVSMAALAKVDPADPRVAQRFELYVAGLELANGFGELTDAAEQRRRFEADMDLKERLYGERYPVDEDFIAALTHGMPESSGIALGFDRLVMLASGAERIEDVLWAPV